MKGLPPKMILTWKIIAEAKIIVLRFRNLAQSRFATSYIDICSMISPTNFQHYSVAPRFNSIDFVVYGF